MTRIARPTLAALSLGLALSLGALPAAQAHRGADDGAPQGSGAVIPSRAHGARSGSLQERSGVPGEGSRQEDPAQAGDTGDAG